jgi:hypothetical protein
VTNVLDLETWGSAGGSGTLRGHFSRLFFGVGSGSEPVPGTPPGRGSGPPREGVPGGSDRGSAGVSGTEIFDLGSTSIRVENLVLGRGDRRVWDPPY